MQQEIGPIFVELSRAQLRAGAEKIEHCLAQLDDREIWWRPASGANSVGNMLLHLAGNVRQWIVSGVGGEPDRRDRPAEFRADGLPRTEVLGLFRDTLREADAALARLTLGIAEFGPEILLTARRVQGFDETLLSAIYDCVTHFRSHAQEIVYVTRLLRKEAYRFHWSPASVEQGAP